MASYLSSFVQHLPESPQVIKDASTQLQGMMADLSANRPVVAKLLKIFGATTVMFAATQVVRRAYYTLYFKSKRYPPGPIGLPFLGVFLSRWPIHNLKKWYDFPKRIAKDYPQICMYPYGPWSYGVMVTDRKLIMRLSKMEQFSMRPPWWALMTPNGIPPAMSLINGPEMLRRRRIFMSTIASMTDSRFFAKYVQQNIKSKIMFPAIEKAIAKDGRWHTVWDECFSLMFNTIYGASFGKRTLPQTDDSYLEFKKITEEMFSQILFFFTLGVLCPGVMQREGAKPKGKDDQTVRTRAIVTGWMKESSQSSDADSEPTEASASAAAAAAKEESYVDKMLAADLDEQTAISEIVLTFQAGAHTTCAGLVNQLYTLAKHQQVQSKIYAQLKELYGDVDSIEMADAGDYRRLQKATFLKAFVEETWRLPLTGMGNPRELLEDVEVQTDEQTYVLPKGALVEFNGPALARDKDTWRTPEEFDINNFLANDGKTYKNPIGSGLDPVFGFGMRNCPARNLARKENLYTIAYLVFNFRFGGPKGADDSDFTVPFFAQKPTFPLTVARR